MDGKPLESRLRDALVSVLIALSEDRRRRLRREEEERLRIQREQEQLEAEESAGELRKQSYKSSRTKPRRGA